MQNHRASSWRIRSRGLVALLAASALVASACGGGDDDAEGDDGDDAPAATDSGDDTDSGDGSGDSSDDPDDGSSSGDDTDDTDDGEDGSDDGDAPVVTQLTSDDEGIDETDLTPQAGGEVIYGLQGDGTGFTTTGAFAADSLRIATAINDSLVGVDDNGDWVPHLAQALTPNDDFTVWTITLRSDVRFHDGVAVDAAAVAANLNAIKASATTGYALAPMIEATVTGELEVTITMSSPWAAFPYLLIGQTGFMVSPDTIGTNESFVGTGPFKLESWTPGDTARVVRNDDYWRAAEGFPYLDAITFKVIPDADARKQALAAGDIDGFATPGDGIILDALADDAVDVYITEATSNDALVILNTTTAPTDDLRIRRAMAHAVDRQLIIDSFRSGLTTPANTFISPNSPWWVETDYPAFDLDAAAALVAEYEAEVGPAELTFKVANIRGSIEVVETIAALWDTVGIDVTVEEIAVGTEVTPVFTDDFQAIYWFQFGAADPDTEYVFFHSSGGPINWSNLVDPDIDAGFDEGRASADPADRKAGYARMQIALVEQLPMLWIDHLASVEAVIVSPELRGVPDGTTVEGSTLVTTGGYFSWEDVWIG